MSLQTLSSALLCSSCDPDLPSVYEPVLCSLGRTSPDDSRDAKKSEAAPLFQTKSLVLAVEDR